MLARSRKVHYLHEPFNPKAFDPEVCELRFEREFTYLCESNSAEARPCLERCLRSSPRLSAPRSPAAPMAGALRRFRVAARGAIRCALSQRPLMKDPHALFSAEWLAECFDMDVVVSIRHPAAFVGSLVVAGWTFRFEQLLEQPLLMAHHLEGQRDAIEAQARAPGDIVDQGIALWNAIYSVVAGYRTRHPDWIFVRHEDLSRDPVRGFADLHARLGLAYTARIARAVADHSGDHNPAERHAGDPVRRDSRANVESWRSRLGHEAIERVRFGTAKVATHYYDADDW